MLFRSEGYIRLLEAILEEAGYTNLKSVTDSRHALPVYDAFQPDLLLLDLTMPTWTASASWNRSSPASLERCGRERSGRCGRGAQSRR